MTVKEVHDLLCPNTTLLIFKMYDELRGKEVPATEENLKKEVLSMYSGSGCITVMIK